MSSSPARVAVRNYPPVQVISKELNIAGQGSAVIYIDPLKGLLDPNALPAPVVAFGAADGIDRSAGPWLDLYGFPGVTNSFLVEIAEASHGVTVSVPAWHTRAIKLFFFGEVGHQIHKIGGTVVRLTVKPLIANPANHDRIELAISIRPHA